MSDTQIRNDFDEIARLSGTRGGGDDRYDKFLTSLVPCDAREVLDVGCGLGRLAARLAAPHRNVTGVDLSPEMIIRAKTLKGAAGKLKFLCGNFVEMEFPNSAFDCVISAAALHHMPTKTAVERMISLVRPGGTLVIHDLRSASGVLDRTLFAVAGVVNCVKRLIRTGRLLPERALREAWAKHGEGETYLSMTQVRALANSLLPSAAYRHWFWKY
ncbi:MAG: methyltransferase domain-containing protein, partial [Acidobacteriota bacterium]|nr:methyltransferase domain-containing protein [Acidobacteriota bacterium]